MATGRANYQGRKELFKGLETYRTSQSAAMAIMPWTKAFSWAPTLHHELFEKPFMNSGQNTWATMNQNYGFINAGEPGGLDNLVYKPTSLTKDKTESDVEKVTKWWTRGNQAVALGANIYGAAKGAATAAKSVGSTIKMRDLFKGWFRSSLSPSTGDMRVRPTLAGRIEGNKAYLKSLKEYHIAMRELRGWGKKGVDFANKVYNEEEGKEDNTSTYSPEEQMKMAMDIIEKGYYGKDYKSWLNMINYGNNTNQTVTGKIGQ